MPQVRATPHPYPRGGELSRRNTALAVIDMQVDFCGPDGYMDRLGADLGLLRAPIEPIRRVLGAARRAGFHILHTREGYRPDLGDVPRWKRVAGSPGLRVGDPGPLGRALVRGEPGWDFLPELAPEAGEPVFDKPGFGAFAFTDIDTVLRGWGVENLVLMGVTTDCCVHSVLREALDRGYDCLVLEDCVGASRRLYHEAALTLVRKESGVFGAVSDSARLIEALSGEPGGPR
jgi:nicotinamidase-related amidase